MKPKPNTKPQAKATLSPSPPPSPSLPTMSAFFDMNHDDHRGPIMPRGNRYDLNSKIMLSAIISLSFVVVLVILLHIYARYVLRRQAHRRRTIFTGLGLTIHSGEPPKTGLDPAVIASLPIFEYKQTNGAGDDATPIECSVCLSVVEDQEMVRLLPNCKHTFHAECIDKWLSSQATCPICRTEAQPRIRPEPREGPAPAGPSAPPMLVCTEGTSTDGGNNSQLSTNKVASSSSGPISRLSSFRRILSRERSSRRIQSEIQEEGLQDPERQ